MVHCSAYNCFVGSRKRKSKKDQMVCSEDAAATLDGPSHPTQIKTLLVFPTNHALGKIWISKMNLINFEVKSHSRLCQDHFEEDQFEVSPKFIASLGLEGIKRPTLKSDAVPTIFDRGSPKEVSKSKERYPSKEDLHQLSSQNSSQNSNLQVQRSLARRKAHPMQEHRPPLTGDSWPHKQVPDL